MEIDRRATQLVMEITRTLIQTTGDANLNTVSRLIDVVLLSTATNNSALAEVCYLATLKDHGQGSKIMAIKHFRSVTNCSLREAKNEIEAYLERREREQAAATTPLADWERELLNGTSN